MIAEFAQIVGLLAAFTAGRQSDDLVDSTQFLKYLTEHGHENLRQSIEQNHNTTISIKALLNSRLDDVSKKLNGISDRLAILLSRSEGMEELAIAYATSALSDQAIEILALMEKNETEWFLLSKEIGTKDQRLILAPGPNYICKETRFFRDDLSLMVSLNLLVQDYNSNGEPMYYFTRAASQLVNSIAP